MDQGPNDSNVNRISSERDGEHDGRRRLTMRHGSTISSSQGRNRGLSSQSNARQCWICFATDEDELYLQWSQPCKCKGTTKWVHQTCLQQWIDEKNKERRDRPVACPQCRTEYLIHFPKASVVIRILDQVDSIIEKTCPFVLMGFMAESLYWTALSYGAIIFLQIGGESSKYWLESTHPTVLLVTLPMVPVAIIVFETLNWEMWTLHLLRWVSKTVPLAGYVLPMTLINESGAPVERRISEGMSCTRIFAGAIFLPTAAVLCGKILFSNTIQSPIVRSLIGGLVFVAVKGVVLIYHEQQVYKRLSKRKILDYNEENKQIIANS